MPRIHLRNRKQKTKLPQYRNFHPETSWDKDRGRVISGSNAAAYNVRIANELTRIERELLSAANDGKLSHSTAKAVARPIVDFFKFAESVIKRMEGDGQMVTARRYRNNLPSIREYAGNTVSIGSIDKDWLSGYERFCKKQYRNPRVKDPEPIAQNTIWSRFKFLRKILLQAQKEELIPICPIGENRGGFPMPAQEKVPKDYLTLDEVDKLFDILGTAGLTPHEDKVLSFFLVECTAGIRHSDWSRFKVEKLVSGEALKVRTKKTGEPVYVPIGQGTRLGRVLAHIKERGYIYTDTETASANKVLKVLSKVAGIQKKITTHTGRHTAATLHLEKGFSREAVADILGVSIRIIDVYAKMTRQKVRSEFEKYGGL